MNERTIELYKDALRFAYDSTQPGEPLHVIDTLAIGKFAELIVSECALQCHNNDDMDRILEHFGVE